MSVTLEKCDPPSMMKALQRLKLAPVQNGDVIRFGNREWINTATGKSQLQQFRNANEIKVAYSGVIVEQTAEEFGWVLEKTGQSEFELSSQF